MFSKGVSTMKSFLPMIVLTIATACPATAVSAAANNVVLIVADDLGRDLGCYGNGVIKTPNLDGLAADGTLFTRAFCTTASCSPSRSVILSGLFNHANGQYGLQHGPHHFHSFDQLHSVSGRLSTAGYRTARIGKFHVEPESSYPFDRELPGNPRNGVQMAERCREFLAARDAKPFFLYFCTTDPHRGGQVGPPPLEPNRFGNEGVYAGVEEVRYDPRQVLVPPFLPDTLTSRAELAEYYQSVTRLDQGVGRLIRVLKETGHWDDTLVIFISDNGIPFPGAKTTTYDPGLRLPCLVRNPHCAKRGLRCDAMISWIDIAPTILEFAGAAVRDDSMHGRSFLSVLDQPNPPGWNEVYCSHTFHEVTMYYPVRGVRTERYKLLWNIAHPLPFPFASDLYRSATWQEALSLGEDARYGRRTVKAYVHRPQFELYDLEEDPDETVNRANDPSYAATLATLKERIRAMQERTKDPWRHKWEYE
jgi:N-sulfoglucosamine sulfohydrolase